MPVLYIVHCIDTEGPLRETLSATFERINDTFGFNFVPSHETLALLQNKQIDLSGVEESVARMISPRLLEYNDTWDKIQSMLDHVTSFEFRNKFIDDFENGWIYSWHCMDHVGYLNNPRHKDVGYGNVFRYYRNYLSSSNNNTDEINWHFHPIAVTGNPLCAATSYVNSYSTLYDLICRRIIEDDWFPVVNRPGFHSERPDSHLFLEQWIPFDYANQSHEDTTDQPDLANGRFGDWSRASTSWRGYHPSIHDYQQEGSCRRTIFRCLNVGTRFNNLTAMHVNEAFDDARSFGSSILAFANHDYRDIRDDVDYVRNLIEPLRTKYSDVSISFCGAEAAARHLYRIPDCPELCIASRLVGNVLYVHCESGLVFGSQPFLALRGHDGKYFHDNFDVSIPDKEWKYVFDSQTIPLSALSVIGVGAAGRYGGFSTTKHVLNS